MAEISESSSVSAVTSASTAATALISNSGYVSNGAAAVSAAPTTNCLDSSRTCLDRHRLEDLVREIDPLEQLDEDVEEVLLQLVDDFIDSVVTSSCQLAKHRRSQSVEAKDVQFHLEHCWNMWVPGFGSDELRPYKKSAATEAHKQRVALIKKIQKKI
jgi:transcription initiation factor TFIID subunit 12